MVGDDLPLPAPGGAVAFLPPDELYTLAPDVPDVRGAVLVEMLEGFIDAGAARRLARDHLLAGGASVLVATFDVDLLFDYRARRPPMMFVEDHWASYDAPRLDVRLLTDADGTGFLLLSGPEPDVMWERFAAAVEQLVARLGVRLSIGTNAIPMAVPHTRPVGVTAHGSRQELLSGHVPWVGTVQVPGSASGLLEFRLGAAGHDALGFAVHVPHYLAQAAYPAAAETLLRAVGAAAGLRFDVAALTRAAEEATTTITALVDQSEELAELVRGLEAQYDAFVDSREGSAALPSAEEIGAELERFLAEQMRKPDEPG
jgi:predicted ATP-grasp superfamily ATP-dependent carboligase